MGRIRAEVEMRIDEAGHHEHASRVDGCVSLAVESVPDVENAVVLVHHHAVGNERVSAAREADHPPAAHEGPHG